MPEPANEIPWSEAEWEAFLGRAGVRSARYAELFETLREHPDRDRIIGREMGWEKPAEGDESWLRELEEAAEASGHGESSAPGTAKARSPHADEEEADVQTIPAYAGAMRFTVHLARALGAPAGEEEPDEEANHALAEALQITGKIAAGHGMGYRDEMLCGNIVNCRRALTALEACASSVAILGRRALLTPEQLTSLIQEIAEVRGTLESRIAELRSRVWW